MKRSIQIFLVFVLFTTFASAFANTQELSDFRDSVKGELILQLGECGLHELDANDPRLPKRKVPADTAFADNTWKVAAYFHRNQVVTPRGVSRDAMIYKRANNGGTLATMDLSNDFLAFSLASGGSRARIWVTYSSSGAITHTYCSGQRSDESFEECLERVFVGPLVDKICP